MAKSDAEISLDKKLIDVYNKHGLKVFLDVCSEMLKIKDRTNFEKKKKSNGEVCEVVLRVMTEHYLKTHDKTGEVFHSMILMDKHNLNSDFKTELDFTLLTPCFCLTGECKSIVGDITVIDKCKLVRNNFEADVGRQTATHVRALRDYLDDFMLLNASRARPPFGTFCFLYSNGTLQDNRTRAAKEELPIITIRSLFKYYDSIFATQTGKVYDYDKACAMFKRLTNSRILHEYHRDYLGY